MSNQNLNLAEACSILGLSEEEVRLFLSLEEIKNHYKTLVKRNHPDNYTGDPERYKFYEEKMKNINNAYSYIQDIFPIIEKERLREKQRKKEAEERKRAQEERMRREAEERRRAQEERQRKEAEARKRAQEERKKREAEEKRRVEEERRKREAEERRRAEEERQRKEAEEKKRAEEERKKQESREKRKEWLNKHLKHIILLGILSLAVIISVFMIRHVRGNRYVEEFYSKTNSLRVEGQLEKYQKVGLWKYYDQSQNLELEEFYSKGKLINKNMYSKGVLQKSFEYTEEGILQKETEFSNTTNEKTMQFFDKNGILLKKEKYLNDKLVQHSEFFPNGSVKKVVTSTKSPSDSIISYYENGNIEREEYTLKDSQKNISKKYDVDGRLLYSLQYDQYESSESQYVYFNNFSHSLQKETHTIKSNTTNKYTVIEYYEDGSIKLKRENDIEVYYSNSGEEVKRVRYYPSGSIKYLKNETEERYYTEEGELLKFVSYNSQQADNTEEKYTYYDNGNLKTITQYRNFEKNGLFTEFLENGTKTVEGYYIDGRKEGEWKSYHENGQLNIIDRYINNKKEGKSYRYSENGTLIREGIYENDLQTGVWRYYFDKSGKIKKVGNWKEDEPHGLWTTYFENGSMESQGYYYYGKQTGRWDYYNQNGSLVEIKQMD